MPADQAGGADRHGACDCGAADGGTTDGGSFQAGGIEAADGQDAGRVPRKATADDLPSVRGVIAAAYARYADRMDRPAAPVLNDYRAETEAGQVWVLGAPVVGVIVLVNRQGSLMVENVAVHPSAQGRGLGRLLMGFAERQAAASGLRRLTLYTNEVMVENMAIYARLGYRETGRRTDGGYRRVFMEKPLGG